MAGGVEVDIQFPELKEIKEAFRGLPKNIAAKYMGAALNKAIEPGLQLLKKLTPKGPTGNLRRAINRKIKRYTKGNASGAAVALAGYVASPKKKTSDLKNNQKGHHAGFLEFGTKDRKTKGNIASSFRRSGPVRLVVAKRSGKMTTNPKPPMGFLKKVAKGGVVDLGKFPIGGKGGVPPVKTAFERSRPAMDAKMTTEMTKALNNALKEMASPFGKRR